MPQKPVSKILWSKVIGMDNIIWYISGMVLLLRFYTTMKIKCKRTIVKSLFFFWHISQEPFNDCHVRWKLYFFLISFPC